MKETIFLAKIDAPVIAGGINVKNDFVSGNRDKLVRFLKGYMEGIKRDHQGFGEKLYR